MVGSTDGETQHLLATLDRIADLLRSPDVPGQVSRAQALALAISQAAPSGAIAELALRVVAALGAISRFPEVSEYMVALNTALRRLREALLASSLPGA
jgi:hypothetical protein